MPALDPRSNLRPYRDPRPRGHKQTAPVGSFEDNAFGLYNMHGNVREWVEDHWTGSQHPLPMRLLPLRKLALGSPD